MITSYKAFKNSHHPLIIKTTSKLGIEGTLHLPPNSGYLIPGAGPVFLEINMYTQAFQCEHHHSSFTVLDADSKVIMLFCFLIPGASSYTPGDEFEYSAFQYNPIAMPHPSYQVPNQESCQSSSGYCIDGFKKYWCNPA